MKSRSQDVAVEPAPIIPMPTGDLWDYALIFLIFAREYSTGVYLLGPGTEVIGSLMVSLWGTGAIDLVSALAVVNTLIIVSGLALALRFGVKLNG